MTSLTIELKCLSVLRVEWLPPTQTLGKHNAKAVDITLVAEFVSCKVLRVKVTDGSLYQSGNIYLVLRGDGGSPKIRDLGPVFLVQEYVGRLNVLVKNWRGSVGM